MADSRPQIMTKQGALDLDPVGEKGEPFSWRRYYLNSIKNYAQNKIFKKI